MKKYLLVITILALLFTAPGLSFAERNSPTTEETEKPATKAAKAENNKMDRLRTRAITAIDNRVASLNQVLKRIQADKNLSESDRSSLNAQINEVIKGLTDLKAKIETDTAIEEIRTDAKKIISDYHVYAIFEPKLRLLITINNLQTFSKKAANLVPKIQDLINNLKSQGKDVAILQAALDDIKEQLKDIDSTLAADKEKVAAIDIKSVASQQTLTAVRKDLAAVRKDFAKIRLDIAKMRNDFKINIKKSTVTPRTPTKSAD